MSEKRPFKIFRDGQKYGVMVSSIDDVMEKSEEKYGVRNVKIRLKDGTYVEDDEYLRALEVNTCLSIVDENEIPPVQRVHVAEMNEDIDDFNFTKLSPPYSKKLTSDNVDIRKDFYLSWANSQDIELMYKRVTNYLEFFFTCHHISEEKDILFSIVRKDISEMVGEISIVPAAELEVYDFCLFPPIPIAYNILQSHNRSYASFNMKNIGFQHINSHKMVDASTSNSSDDDILDEPLKKKLKTCQLSVFVDCENMKTSHQGNTTPLTKTDTKIDILILCHSSCSEICENLAKHLGIIFIEGLLNVIQINAKKTDLLVRLQKDTSKIYRVLQSYVNKYLMGGCSSIGLTCNFDIFENFKADTKCGIYINWDDFKTMVPYVHISAKINKHDLLQYVSAIADIVDKINMSKVSMDGFYCRKVDGKEILHKVKIPIVSIVPMYIINFFSRKRLIKANNETLV